MPVSLPIVGSTETYPVSPSKIIAIGLNYRAHIAESESVRVRGMDGEIPDEPVLFNKTPNVLISTGETIPLPSVLADYAWPGGPRTDYEGELVVVMGKGGRHIPEVEALGHVLGYTCGVDVSQRNIQNGDKSGWFRGKSFDGFGPVGPALLPASEVADPQALDLRTRLNGRTVQESNTRMMIFPVSRLIAHISRQMTLEAGDLIFTGTPSGVGAIAHGDVVEVEITGIGTLRCPVADEGRDRT